MKASTPSNLNSVPIKSLSHWAESVACARFITLKASTSFAIRIWYVMYKVKKYPSTESCSWLPGLNGEWQGSSVWGGGFWYCFWGWWLICRWKFSSFCFRFSSSWLSNTYTTKVSSKAQLRLVEQNERLRSRELRSVPLSASPPKVTRESSNSSFIAYWLLSKETFWDFLVGIFTAFTLKYRSS
jgi:hypothetical protein